MILTYLGEDLSNEQEIKCRCKGYNADCFQCFGSGVIASSNEISIVDIPSPKRNNKTLLINQLQHQKDYQEALRLKKERRRIAEERRRIAEERLKAVYAIRNIIYNEFYKLGKEDIFINTLYESFTIRLKKLRRAHKNITKPEVEMWADIAKNANASASKLFDIIKEEKENKPYLQKRLSFLNIKPKRYINSIYLYEKFVICYIIKRHRKQIRFDSQQEFINTLKVLLVNLGYSSTDANNIRRDNSA